MKTIQIRRVPDDLHRALKARAASEGITMSELIRRELPCIAHRPSLDQILERIKRREPVTRGLSSAELIRRDRECRSPS
jgi:hypothetical protein